MSTPIDPLRHAVIEASAGTGKTYTLEHLVVDLVRRGAPIDRILVATFTEKATREMRVRVRARLAEAAKEDPALSRSLAGFDRAAISTIHGFCQRLLTEHAFASGRSFDSARVDARAAFGRALRSTMRAAEGDVLGVLSAALGAMTVDAIEECLFSFHRETCPVRPDASVERVQATLAMLPDVADVEPFVRVVAHQPEQARVRAELPTLFALARRARVEPIGRVLPALLEWALVVEGRKSQAERTVVALAKALAPHETLGPALDALVETVGSPVPLLAHVVLPAVREVLARDKRDHGLYDYDDLLALVLEALRGPNGPALVRAVRARYRHALVDEFQDTDERQWEIFRRLFFDGEGSTTLAVIGDPKQAIYGFRGADVHTYERAIGEMQAGGAAQRVVLDRSWRTSAGLLEAIHAILLPPAPATPFFSGVVDYDAPVRAAREALRVIDAAGADAPPMRLFHLVADGGELRMKSARRALAAAYATEIEALVAGGARVVDEAGARTLDASDVFVLTRTSAEGDEVGEALRARGIPFTFFKKDGLFATDEAKDVLDVLRALVSPRDRRARVRALATAIFAVPVESLRDAAELPAEHSVRRTFDRLVALAGQRELAPLLRAIVDETGLAQRELYLHATERRLTNYLHVLEVLLSMSHRGRLSLRDLAERLGELTAGRARPSEEEDVQRLPSERAAVQVLTIHKAKGLEAPAVFLFGGFGQRPASEHAPVVLHGPASGAPTGRYAWAGVLPSSEKARLRSEEDQEAQRLYYVALTRAASLLYLPYLGARPGADGASPKMRGPYRVVHAQLERLVRAGLDPARIARREIEALEVPAPPLARAPIPPAPAAPPIPRLGAKTTKALRHALSGAEVTSYSRMKAGKAEADRWREPAIDEAVVEREDLLGEAVDRTGPEPVRAGELPGGPAVGVMVHEILEHLPMEAVRAAPQAGPRPDEWTALAIDAADRNGLPDTLAHDALELALRAVWTPVRAPGLSLPRGLCTPTRRLPEMPFVHPIPTGTVDERGPDTLVDASTAMERGYVRGVVDLLFEHEGKLWVLDWKTDRLASYGEAAMRAHVEAHYEVQVRLYTLACARAFGLSDRDAYEARFGGLLYVFVRGLDEAGAGALFLRPPAEALARWERDLASSDAPWGYPLPARRSPTALDESVLALEGP